MKILITGCAGFIGYSLCIELLKNKKYKIYGIDNLNDYYDINLKKNRLKQIKNKIYFYNINLENKKKIENNFKKNNYDICIHLAAQAGVRYSIDKPEMYFESNLSGFFNILESCKKNSIKHLIFASSSSVYGDADIFPQTENQPTDKPISFYAATKKANEVMAYSYSSIYKIRCTALRFFTVYGPYGRPDMAFYKFANAIKNNQTIKLFNNGKNIRDYTYIDDVISYINNIIKKRNKSKKLFDVFNICNSKPINTISLIKIFENSFNKKAKVKYTSSAKGDVVKTSGSSKKLLEYKNFEITNINKGVIKYLDWFNEYYK